MEGEVEYIFLSYCQCPSPQWIEVPASQHHMVGWRYSPSNDTLQYPAALQKRNTHMCMWLSLPTSALIKGKLGFQVSSKTHGYKTSIL